MENVTEVIKTFLESKGYKIKEIDDDGFVSVRYQMNMVHICPNHENKQFVSMLLPDIDELNGENTMPVVLNCMQVVSQMMVVKAYPIGNDNVVACYEFFFNNEDDLKFQIEKGFESLIAAKVRYRKYKQENKN